MKKLRVLHIVNVIIWFVSSIISAGHIKACYTQLFGRYLNYTIFQVIEIAYILGGLLLLDLLYKRIRNWAFVIYEIIWVIFILIHLKIYFSCHLA